MNLNPEDFAAPPKMVRVKKPSKAEVRALYEADEAKRLAEFRKDLPMKLLLLMAKASEVAETTVLPNGDSVRVEFRFHDDDRETVSLGMESEEWSLDMVENTVQRLKDAREAARKKLELARATWDSLSPEQRAALNLGYRP